MSPCDKEKKKKKKGIEQIHQVDCWTREEKTLISAREIGIRDGKPVKAVRYTLKEVLRIWLAFEVHFGFISQKTKPSLLVGALTLTAKQSKERARKKSLTFLSPSQSVAFRKYIKRTDSSLLVSHASKARSSLKNPTFLFNSRTHPDRTT